MARIISPLPPYHVLLSAPVDISTSIKGVFPSQYKSFVNNWPSNVRLMYGELLYDRWLMDLYYVSRNAIFHGKNAREQLVFVNLIGLQRSVFVHLLQALFLAPVGPDYLIVGQPAVFPSNGGLYLHPLVAHTTAQRKGFIAGYFGEGLGRSVLTKALGLHWTRILKIEPVRDDRTPDFVVLRSSNRIQALAEVKSTTKSAPESDFKQLKSVKGAGNSEVLGLGVGVAFHLAQNKPATVVVKDPEYQDITFDVTVDLYFKTSLVAAIREILTHQQGDGGIEEFRQTNRGLLAWTEEVSTGFERVFRQKGATFIQFRIPTTPEKHWIENDPLGVEVEWVVPDSVNIAEFTQWLEILFRPPINDSANFFGFLRLPY